MNIDELIEKYEKSKILFENQFKTQYLDGVLDMINDVIEDLKSIDQMGLNLKPNGELIYDRSYLLHLQRMGMNWFKVCDYFKKDSDYEVNVDGFYNCDEGGCFLINKSDIKNYYLLPDGEEIAR